MNNIVHWIILNKSNSFKKVIKQFLQPKPVDMVFLYYDIWIDVHPNSSIGYYLLKSRLAAEEQGSTSHTKSIARQKVNRACLRKHYCEYCNDELNLFNRSSLDHIIPKFENLNPDILTNYSLSCHDCNTIKGSINKEKQPELYNFFIEQIIQGEKSKKRFWEKYFETILTQPHKLLELCHINRCDLPLEIIKKLMEVIEYRKIIFDGDPKFGNVLGRFKIKEKSLYDELNKEFKLIGEVECDVDNVVQKIPN